MLSLFSVKTAADGSPSPKNACSSPPSPVAVTAVVSPTARELSATVTSGVLDARAAPPPPTASTSAPTAASTASTAITRSREERFRRMTVVEVIG